MTSWGSTWSCSGPFSNETMRSDPRPADIGRSAAEARVRGPQAEVPSKLSARFVDTFVKVGHHNCCPHGPESERDHNSGTPIGARRPPRG